MLTCAPFHPLPADLRRLNEERRDVNRSSYRAERSQSPNAGGRRLPEHRRQTTAGDFHRVGDGDGRRTDLRPGALHLISTWGRLCSTASVESGEKIPRSETRGAGAFAVYNDSASLEPHASAGRARTNHSMAWRRVGHRLAAMPASECSPLFLTRGTPGRLAKAPRVLLC